MQIKKPSLFKRSGEIATTVTLITLAFMVVGAFLGTRDTVRKSVKTYFSLAAEVKCLDKCTTENARNGALVCRDLKRSPLIKTLYWVQFDAPSSCNLNNNACLCPASGSVTPTSVPNTLSPAPTVRAGSSFRATPGSCQVIFEYIVDPKVSYVELSEGSNSVRLDRDLRELSGKNLSDERITTKAGSLSIKYNPKQGGNGYTKDQIYVAVKANGVTQPSILLYTRPSWMDGTKAIQVVFAYEETIAGKKVLKQQLTQMNPDLLSCAQPPTPTSINTPTPSRIPTVTPKPFCSSPCFTDADCRNIPGVRNPICYINPSFPTPGTTGSPSLLNGRTDIAPGVCRESACRSSLSCSCPRATVPPTVPPTRVPTSPPNTPFVTPISPVPSRIPTTPPASCPKNITFLLDTSSTMYTGGKLNEAITAITNRAPKTGVNYRLVAFNRLVQNITTGFVAYDQLITALGKARGQASPGTNLPGAVSNSAGTVILLSDGIPSYDSGGCFYGNSIEMSKVSNLNRNAEGPQKLRATYRDPNDPSSKQTTENCAVRPYGWALADTLAASSGKTIHAIEVKSGQETNQALLRAIGTGSYRNVADLDKAVEQVISQLCPGTPSTSTGNSTANSQKPQQTQNTTPAGRGSSVTSTFSLTNSTTSRVVEELAVNLCDSNQVCKEYVEKVNVQPGQTVSVPTIFQGLPQNGVYVVKCALKYSDGTSESCPESQINAGSASKVAVNISEATPLSVQSKVKEKPCDVNNDGACNTLDYALAIAHYGEKAPESFTTADAAGDANLDGKVDATDISIILAGLGQ